jgi:hypothetical protein
MKRNIASRLPFLLESIGLPQTLVCSGRYWHTQLEPNGTAIDTIVVIGLVVNALRRSLKLGAGNIVKNSQAIALRSHLLTLQIESRVYPPHQHVFRIDGIESDLPFVARISSRLPILMLLLGSHGIPLLRFCIVSPAIVEKCTRVLNQL